MTDKFNQSLRFVVRHYRPGAFVPDARTLGVVKPMFFTRKKAAAAAFIGCVLAASAITWYTVVHQPTASPVAQPECVEESRMEEMAETRLIEFNNADLHEVVAQIEKTYGVKIAGMPADEYRLTLSYEGTATEIVDMINSVLGTDLKIEEEK